MERTHNRVGEWPQSGWGHVISVSTAIKLLSTSDSFLGSAGWFVLSPSREGLLVAS